MLLLSLSLPLSSFQQGDALTLDFHLKREKFQLMMGLIRMKMVERQPLEVLCATFCHLLVRV